MDHPSHDNRARAPTRDSDQGHPRSPAPDLITLRRSLDKTRPHTPGHETKHRLPPRPSSRSTSTSKRSQKLGKNEEANSTIPGTQNKPPRSKSQERLDNLSIFIPPSQRSPSQRTTLKTDYDKTMASRQPNIETLPPKDRQEQETWAQSQLRQNDSSGSCAFGFGWRRIEGGYRCNGGNHLVTDELLMEGSGGSYCLNHIKIQEGGEEFWGMGTRGTMRAGVRVIPHDRMGPEWDGPYYGEQILEFARKIYEWEVGLRRPLSPAMRMRPSLVAGPGFGGRRFSDYEMGGVPGGSLGGPVFSRKGVPGYGMGWGIKEGSFGSRGRESGNRR